MRNLKAIISATCLLMSTQIHAAVIERDWKTPGDGLLTYDDVNKREWLDLTESRLLRFAMPGDSLVDVYQAVVAETLPGGEYAGFSLAKNEDVLLLAESIRRQSIPQSTKLPQQT